MKLGMYIIATESISSVNFINPISLCAYVYPIFAGQPLVAAANTRISRIVLRVTFYRVHVLSKESLSFYVYHCLDSNSVQTFAATKNWWRRTFLILQCFNSWEL
jgi:hypothetical protein